jgi:hypothetical protein
MPSRPASRSFLAGRYGRKVGTERLEKWFAYLTFAVAVFVLAEVIFVH